MGREGLSYQNWAESAALDNMPGDVGEAKKNKEQDENLIQRLKNKLEKSGNEHKD